MKKNKKVVNSIVFVFIIVLFSIVGTPRYQYIKIESEGFLDFENNLKEASIANSEIDIKQLTNFDWDECYVLDPYYPSEEIYEKVGAEWTTAKTFIGFLMFHSIENEIVNEDQFVMVFKKENKVVIAKRYNLKELPVIFKLDNNKFESNNAKFLVTVSKLYDKGEIKELVLKN